MGTQGVEIDTSYGGKAAGALSLGVVLTTASARSALYLSAR